MTNNSMIEGPRGARTNEFTEVLDFQNYVFRSNQGRQPTMGSDYPHLYRENNCDNLRHMRDDGQVISCVCVYPAQIQWDQAVLKIGGIGGVATHPDYRKQGHAGKVLQDCIDMMKSQDYDLSILWTGINGYYRRWGWENAGHQHYFKIDRSTIGYLPSAPSGEILTDTRDPRMIDGVLKLHRKMARGIVWDTELTEIMLNILYKNSAMLLMVDNKPAGYIIYNRGGATHVKMWGGATESVLGLLRVAFGQQNARDAEIESPLGDTGPGQWLMGRGFHAQTEMAGMLLLINPERILRKYGIDDIAIAPVSDDWMSWNVTIDGETKSYTRNELSKLIFGPEHQPGKHTHPRLPVPIFYGGVDHM
jgi:predicted GNAT family N-acyltransferase